LELTLALACPLIFAAMGGFTSERGGVINIGLEGLMPTSACVTALVSTSVGPGWGLLAGVLSSVLLSLVHWLTTQLYKIDHVISGMAVNAIAIGGTNFLFGRFNDPSRAGSIVFVNFKWFEPLAVLLPIGLWAYARYTRGGLRLRAVGSDPDKARLAGISPVMVRCFGLLATGLFAGLGGAMIVSFSGGFVDQITAGKGYIALAALIVGGWRPLAAFGACLAFGFFTALQVQFQGQTVAGLQPPPEFWQSLPYIATVIALAGFLGKNRTPAGLGKS